VIGPCLAVELEVCCYDGSVALGFLHPWSKPLPVPHLVDRYKNESKDKYLYNC
jgi:hypothetical protein